MKRSAIIVSAVAVVLWGAFNASAATVNFEINLDGLQETPPLATPGYGLGSLSLNDTTGDYTLSGNFYDLIGTTTGAHIHGPGTFGVPAGIITPITFDVGVSTGTFSGAGTFTAPQMADLISELYYVNIHTTLFSGGEIRGQIRQVPEPASMSLLALGGIVAVIAGAVRWRRRSA
jgi:hypothetical protein